MKVTLKQITRHLWQFIDESEKSIGFVRRLFDGPRTFYQSQIDEGEAHEHETMDDAVLALREAARRREEGLCEIACNCVLCGEQERPTINIVDERDPTSIRASLIEVD